jgi:hypothetical protein
MDFWTGFEKRALSPQLVRAAALRASQKASNLAGVVGHDAAQTVKARGQAQRFANYAINKSQAVQKANEAAKGTFAGLSKKTEPQVLNYAAMNKADLERRRARMHAAGSTIDYSVKTKTGPLVTPNTAPNTPKTPDPAAWSKINQAKRARILEQERTGVIR